MTHSEAGIKGANSRWKTPTLHDKIWSKIKTASVEDCWNWTGARNHASTSPLYKFAYGRLRVRGKNFVAHRLVWTELHGDIPRNLSVCHTCDNPICCNPNHLFIGTQKENSKDMLNKGRFNPPWKGKFGDIHPQTKYPDELVKKAIEAYKTSSKKRYEIAEEFGINPFTFNGFLKTNNHRKCSHPL